MKTIFWTLAAVVALLWPARMIGVLDGIPLDGRLEAIVIGLAVPAFWWLDRGYLGRRFAQTLIVALLAWKALLMGVAVPHGLCARFSTAAPLAGEILTIPIEEPRGVLRSWDVRADWRAADPSCTAIVDRSYGTAAAFPAWFVNLVDFVRPGPRQITMDLSGYVQTREPGIFALQVGSDMAFEGTMDGVLLATASGRAEAHLLPGTHRLVARSSMTGERWQLRPLWNGAEAWREIELTTERPARFDRLLWPVASSLTVILVLLLVGGWAVSALSGVDARVIGWSAAAACLEVVLAGSDRFDRLAGLLLLGAVWIPVRQSARGLKSAFVLLGIPWLVFFAAHSAAQIGHLTAYSSDDWLAYQVAGYRIFMNGFWLEARQPGVRLSAAVPLDDRGAASDLRRFERRRSLLGRGVHAGGRPAVRQDRQARRRICVGDCGGAAMLATFTLGTPWYFVGRGLSEIAAAGWAFSPRFSCCAPASDDARRRLSRVRSPC